MSVIIDGYNLIYASSRWLELLDEGSIEQARDDMLHCLERYYKDSRQKVTVVFDGKPGPQMNPGPREPLQRVRAMFTKERGAADDKIIDLVASSATPREILVVSSDKEIQNAVKEYGAKIKKSHAYRVEVFEKLKQQGKIKAESTKECPEITYAEYLAMLRESEVE